MTLGFWSGGEMWSGSRVRRTLVPRGGKKRQGSHGPPGLRFGLAFLQGTTENYHLPCGVVPRNTLVGHCDGGTNKGWKMQAWLQEKAHPSKSAPLISAEHPRKERRGSAMEHLWKLHGALDDRVGAISRPLSHVSPSCRPILLKLRVVCEARADATVPGPSKASRRTPEGG